MKEPLPAHLRALAEANRPEGVAPEAWKAEIGGARQVAPDTWKAPSGKVAWVDMRRQPKKP